MHHTVLVPGKAFPHISVPTLRGDVLTLGKTHTKQAKWQLVVIYRGAHSILCTKYLEELDSMQQAFLSCDTDIIVVSSDPLNTATRHVRDLCGLTLCTGYDLSIDQMHSLGLYISDPQKGEENDRPFAEPALFLVDDEHIVQMLSLSSSTYARADLKTVLEGTKQLLNSPHKPITGSHV
tara:strand:+ start:168 stop:704 length:537 start_codon:yes stop_codon:yes gene_type:complete